MTTYSFTPSGLAGINTCVRKTVGGRFIPHMISAGYDIRPDERSIAAMAGGYLHDAAAMPPEERGAWINDTLPDAVEKNIQSSLDRGDNFEWDATTPGVGVLQKQVANMALAVDAATEGMFWREPDRWLREHAITADLTPVVREVLELDTEDAVHLRGRFDFYDTEKNVVMDLKTGKASEPSDAGVQLACYKVLLKTIGHTPEDYGEIYYTRRHSYTTRTPEQSATRHYRYQLREYLSLSKMLLVEAVRHAREFWRTGNPHPNGLPADPSCRLCSPKFCRLYGSTACLITRDEPVIFIPPSPPKGENNGKQ